MKAKCRVRQRSLAGTVKMTHYAFISFTHHFRARFKVQKVATIDGDEEGLGLYGLFP